MDALQRAVDALPRVTARCRALVCSSARERAVARSCYGRATERYRAMSRATPHYCMLLCASVHYRVHSVQHRIHSALQRVDSTSVARP